MSSTEARLKKLRGSGGFIMAYVTDDQQRKGNLGGPDLFLAPIGRLNSDKITKYHCNSCEKDFDDIPEIKYENPNEPVADNLVLTEKGRYICKSCEGIIAEYRSFSKQNEAAEVGSAIPEQQQAAQQLQSQQQQQSEAIYPADMPSAEATAAGSQTTQPQSTTPSHTEQSQENIPQGSGGSTIASPPTALSSRQSSSNSGIASFNSIIGVEVYDDSARKLGKVKEVGVQAGYTGVVLVVTKTDGKESIIKMDEIKKIGDIILLGSDVAAEVSRGTQDDSVGESQSSIMCKSCSFQNRSDSKFCENCGTKL